MWSFTTSGNIQTLALSENGDYLVVGTNADMLYLFNKTSNIPMWTFTAGAEIWDVAISRNGKHYIRLCPFSG